MDERQQDHYQQPAQQLPQPPDWGAPAVQPPAYYAPTPAPLGKPRPKWKTPLIAGAALVVGVIIGAAAGGGGSKSGNAPAASGSVSTSAPASAPASAAPRAAAAAATSAAAAAESAAPPAPVPATNVVLQVSGNGQKSTKEFTVASDWSVKYSYDCSGGMGQGNFIVTEHGGDNDGMPIVNLLGAKGSDITYQHSDAGKHSLEIDSECNWTVTVTSGDAG